MSVAPVPRNSEDRSEDETFKQERCAGKEAWEMTKSIHKLNGKDKATLLSLEVWCPRAPSLRKPKEREFVVDSRASMPMLSRKDLHSAELDAMLVSRKVQTSEEATVYVYDLDSFLTVQILEDTPAVLSLGKLCEDHGYFFEWTSGQKTHILKKKRQEKLQHGKSPATKRSRSTRSRVLGSQLRGSAETKNRNKIEDIDEALGARCVFCQNGWRNSVKI